MKILEFVISENCTCGYPNDKYATYTNHSVKCPVNIEYWKNQTKRVLDRIESIEVDNIGKKQYLGYSDNVE